MAKRLLRLFVHAESFVIVSFCSAKPVLDFVQSFLGCFRAMQNVHYGTFFFICQGGRIDREISTDSPNFGKIRKCWSSDFSYHIDSMNPLHHHLYQRRGLHVVHEPLTNFRANLTCLGSTKISHHVVTILFISSFCFLSKTCNPCFIFGIMRVEHLMGG